MWSDKMFPLSYLGNEDEQDDDMPFLVPILPHSHDKCSLLVQFKLVVKDLPEEVRIFLQQNLLDTYFTQLRQSAGGSTDILCSDRLRILYQAIKLCPHKKVPHVIAAISIITGFHPRVILDHNRIHVTPVQLSILEAVHKKASVAHLGPHYGFSCRIETVPMAEILPSTVLWSLEDNPFADIEIPDWLFTDQQVPDDDTLTDLQKSLLVPLTSDEMSQSLTDQQLWFLRGPSIRKSPKSPFFFSKDLSDGFNPAHGLPPVPCYNEIDDMEPPPIMWISDLEIPDFIPQEYTGCACVSGDCNGCHVTMVKKKQEKNWRKTMTYLPDGRINLDQLNGSYCPLVIECNRECKCNALNCRNRVLQNRSRVQLMVTRAKSKSGWGVRAMQFIPAGTFVCEYLGSVISDPVVAEVMGMEYDADHESYLFDLDAYNIPDDLMLTVDPSHEGNISKYINHSCDPNLIQISVGTVNSQRFHRIGFFALRDIYPNEELGFHYGYEFEKKDAGRFIECNCGCVGCRTRLR